MSERNKDRLENFFIKGTHKYDFEYQEADWQKLAKKLDEAEKGMVWPFFRSNGLKIITGVMIAGLAIYLILSQVSEPVATEMTSSESKVEMPEGEQELEVNRSVENSDDPSEHPANSDVPPNAENTLVDNSKGIQENGLTNTDSNTRPTSSTNSKAQPHSNGEHEVVNKSQSGEIVVQSGQPVGVVDDVENRETDTNLEAMLGEGYGDRQLFYRISPMGLPLLAYQYSGYDIQPIGLGEDTELLPEKASDRPAPALVLSLMYSPDLSSVGLGDFSDTGARMGGYLSYSFNRIITLRVGAVKIKNYYTADGSQYKPSGFGTYSQFSAISATGQCEILEIPINIRLNYLNRNKHHLFLTGGLSSYIMMDEQYEFEYGYNPPPNAMESWRSNGTSSHILGVLNLSTGYEYDLARRWSLQVEPFINIPITGIGWGNVNLYSVGSYFTINYVIMPKKQTNIKHIP